MAEPRRAFLPAGLGGDVFESRAWVHRVGTEMPVIGSRVFNSLERYSPGSSRSSLTPSPSRPKVVPRLTPPPPDTLLLSLLRRDSTGSLDLSHGVSGVLNLPPSTSEPTLVAPSLNPAMTALRASSPSLRNLFLGSNSLVPSRPASQQSPWCESARGKYGSHVLSPGRARMVSPPCPPRPPVTLPPCTAYSPPAQAAWVST